MRNTFAATFLLESRVGCVCQFTVMLWPDISFYGAALEVDGDTLRIFALSNALKLAWLQCGHIPVMHTMHAEGPGWEFDGNDIFKMDLWGNYAVIKPHGELYVKFHDGDEYVWSTVRLKHFLIPRIFDSCLKLLGQATILLHHGKLSLAITVAMHAAESAVHELHTAVCSILAANIIFMLASTKPQ